MLRESASQACALLKALANEDRLLLLCQLVGHERNVGELEALTGIRQPTLSQQLGVLRDEGLVATRRDGKYVYYQMASFEVSQVMKTLSSLYCGKAMDACTRNRNHDSGLECLHAGTGCRRRPADRRGRRAADAGGRAHRRHQRHRRQFAAARAGRRLAARVPAGPVRVPWFYQLYAALPPATIEAGPLRLVVAGLLVGLGTRYASGCTSGHGVCGLSRGSRRSLAATALCRVL